MLPRREFLALAGALSSARAAAAESLRPPPARSVLPRSWLQAPTLPLWPGDPPGAAGFAAQPLPPGSSAVFVRNVANPVLHVFRPARSNGRAVIVVPGGSYEFVSVANEGLDPAIKLTAMGTVVCVLTYRLPGEGWSDSATVPLQDAQRAMRVVRSRASQWAIDPNKVGILGFSAGGHVAATLATQHAEHTYDPVDSADELDPRPAAAGLIYPVVTLERPWTHEVSRKHLLGESPSSADVARRCAEQHVDSSTPPAFIVHAFDDPAVPVENSLRFMEAMRAARRPVEAHLLQEGGHGFGIGLAGAPCEHWPDLFSSWLSRLA